jgi:hypothetical protein
VEKARLSLGDAEVSATAEVEAQEAAAQAEEAASGAGEAAAQAQAALAAAEVAVKEADKFAAAETVAPDAQVELAPPAPASRSPSPTPVPAEQGAAAAAAGEVAPPPPPEPVPIPPSLAGALLKVREREGAQWRCMAGICAGIYVWEEMKLKDKGGPTTAMQDLTLTPSLLSILPPGVALC